jgi:hypothetical protein
MPSAFSSFTFSVAMAVPLGLLPEPFSKTTTMTLCLWFANGTGRCGSVQEVMCAPSIPRRRSIRVSCGVSSLALLAHVNFTESSLALGTLEPPTTHNPAHLMAASNTHALDRGAPLPSPPPYASCVRVLCHQATPFTLRARSIPLTDGLASQTAISCCLSAQRHRAPSYSSPPARRAPRALFAAAASSIPRAIKGAIAIAA